MIAVASTEATMRVCIDDLEVRGERLDAIRPQPQSRDKQNQSECEIAVATVWLAFYLLALATAVSSPVLSPTIDLAAR
jgi:hypothetical protein